MTATRTATAAPRRLTLLLLLLSATTAILLLLEPGLGTAVRGATPAAVVWRGGGWAQRELTRPSRLLFRVGGERRERAAPGTRHLSTALRGGQQHPQPVHAALASFLVPAFGASFTLDLQLNHDLLAVGYRERHFDENGRPVEKQGGELCHYHGKLRGIRDSFVAVSTCHGLHGMFHDGNHTYLIEPAGLPGATQEAEPHVVYRGSDQDAQALLPELTPTIGLNTSAGGLGLLSSAKMRTRRELETEMKYMELSLVNDHIMFKKHRQILGLTNNYAKSIVNMVDAIYKEQLNTRVVLVSMETWTNENRITVSTDPLQTLRAFMKYRRQAARGPHGDALHLLSGLMFESSHSGVAYFGGVCSLQRGGGVNEYGNVAAMVVTLAQGIGQNLGMLWHNSKAAAKGCQCTDTWYGCIMEVTGQVLPLRFSQCSLDEYQEFLQAGGGACLFNKPTQLFEAPDCGNGFVELGEECDCGSASECSDGWDKCCKKCTFTHGATCSSGLCCGRNNCQFVSRGEECRRAVGECDLPETCPGDSVQCPPNVHKQDGYSCNKNGRCYSGQCKTREKQCKYIWGDKGMSSDRQCYDQLNIEGTEKGNCGRKADSWLQCSKHDVLCGFLLCTNVSREPQLGELQGEPVKVSLQRNGHLLECSGGHVVLADGSDLGYVEDGTPCGRDVVCLDRKCQPLQALNLSACPSVTQASACSGHGVCSNEARCVCERHWVGNDCNIHNPIPEVEPTTGIGVQSRDRRSLETWTRCTAVCRPASAPTSPQRTRAKDPTASRTRGASASPRRSRRPTCVRTGGRAATPGRDLDQYVEKKAKASSAHAPTPPRPSPQLSLIRPPPARWPPAGSPTPCHPSPTRCPPRSRSARGCTRRPSEEAATWMRPRRTRGTWFSPRRPAGFSSTLPGPLQGP